MTLRSTESDENEDRDSFEMRVECGRAKRLLLFGFLLLVANGSFLTAGVGLSYNSAASASLGLSLVFVGVDLGGLVLASVFAPARQACVSALLEQKAAGRSRLRHRDRYRRLRHL